MQFQVARALDYYRDAFGVAAAADRNPAPGAGNGGDLSDRCLAEIRADGSQVLTQRVALTPLRNCGLRGKRGSKADSFAPRSGENAKAGSGAPESAIISNKEEQSGSATQRKNALVTAASQGIGRAIAKVLPPKASGCALPHAGASLLERLAAEIAAAGGAQPQIAIVDIMEEGAPHNLARSIEGPRPDRHPDHCAGGSRPPIAIDAAEEDWTLAMALNFIRVRQLTHALLPAMIERKWGRIINITGNPTGEADRGDPAKAAVHAWAKGLSPKSKVRDQRSTASPPAYHERTDPPQILRGIPRRAIRARNPGPDAMANGGARRVSGLFSLPARPATSPAR